MNKTKMAFTARTARKLFYVRGLIAFLLVFGLILFGFSKWMHERHGDHIDVTFRSSGGIKPVCEVRATQQSGQENPDYDYVQEMKKMNQEKVAADNPRLVELIRNYYIAPPSTLPYNLSFPETVDRSMGQAPIVDSRLNFKECGFYLESGAFDGEFLTNTLFFEQTRGWTGVLIEPNPFAYKKLLSKHRKAFAINACLSTEDYPSEKLMNDDGVMSKVIEGKQKTYARKPSYRIQCFPLYSILLALNQTHVDFLSLDMEGVERGVLDNIPWNKISIQMMTIEYDKWPGGSKSLCNYMESRGYECLVKIEGWAVADVILRRKTGQKRRFAR